MPDTAERSMEVNNGHEDIDVPGYGEGDGGVWRDEEGWRWRKKITKMKKEDVTRQVFLFSESEVCLWNRENKVCKSIFVTK